MLVKLFFIWLLLFSNIIKASQFDEGLIFSQKGDFKNAFLNGTLLQKKAIKMHNFKLD